MDIELPSGKIITGVPEGTSKEEIMKKAIAAGLATPEDFGMESATTGDKAVGTLETIGTVGSSMIAEPIAGLAGIAQSINPFADEGAGAQAVQATREALTYEPRTEEGKEQLQSVGEALSPVGEVLEGVERGLGETVLEKTGSPELAAIAHSLPTAVLEAIGIKGTGRAKSIAKAVPDDAAQSVLDASKKFDVPVMTSDVAPPKTYAGRFAQSLNEKLGVLGSGKARASQQVARENAVQGLADNLDIDLDSDFADQIVKNLNKESARKLQSAGGVRSAAVKALDEYGEVPLTKTMEVIDEQLAKQAKLKDRANPQIVSKLESTKSAIEGGDFSQAKNIRTEVISDLIDVRKGDDTARAEPIYQSVKSAIDEDMKSFAKAKDRDAAARWERSNRMFADELDTVKRTELKRILNSGQSTPEQVMPLLRGGKPSQLNRLYKSLDDTGRESARKAIIQDALKDSKFFEVDANPNPNAFATALNKPNRQQAIKVFFKGKDKAEIDGLNRLLNATRRSQDAAQLLRTGEQAILPAAGGAAGVAVASEPVLGLAALTTASGLAKAYESKTFRNLLLKLRNTKKGSKQEKELLELAAAIAAGESQVAKTRQEEQEQIE
ncbi:MAG: hypothetical protein GY727_00615 [Gammaproteobacteria bacterium]|nr:hypothetical protein [Gammaproteobacteria bacterium]MCP4972824.1 hypothetical protein [Prochlorococcus sp.]